MTPYPTTVMVVDDDVTLRESVRAIAARRGFTSVVPGDAEEALRCFRQRPPSAVVLDVVMPGERGFDTLAAFKRIDRDVPVLVVSGHGQPSTVIQAMGRGAADFLCKPVTEAQLESALHRILAERQIGARLASLRTEIEAEPPYRLVGSGHGPVAELQGVIDRLAETDVPVLLRGERGTGKERLARALHGASPRKDGPFIKVNCTAGPGDLLEASLFGYERGSLNGAVHQRPGKLEFANHGTIYFEEVASLSGSLQARLLHALREGRFCRHGGQNPVDIDARVTAATSEDLRQAIAEGRFREDLLFRLNVVDITLPPLRDRAEDVRPLAEYFLTRFSVHYNTPRPRLSPETWRLFEEHVWPGNVAELESIVRRLVVLGHESQVQRDVVRAREEWLSTAAARRPPASTVPAAAVNPGNGGGAGPLPASGSLKEIARAAAREAERVAIIRMLRRTRWNRKEAAEILGISYKALLYKIKENGLDKPTCAT